MRTFGGFRSGDEFFYGEVRGEEVHRLAQPYWARVQPTGEVLPLANLQIEIPVAPSKLIAVGLNYADHIAEMKRTEFGAPLIWFKAPSSLLAHNGESRSRSPNIKPILKLSSLSSSALARRMSAPPMHSVTFSVTRSASTSPIAICKNKRSNLAAANHSTPTRRLDHSCTRMWMFGMFR